jgi:hypothetical protein
MFASREIRTAPSNCHSETGFGIFADKARTDDYPIRFRAGSHHTISRAALLIGPVGGGRARCATPNGSRLAETAARGDPDAAAQLKRCILLRMKSAAVTVSLFAAATVSSSAFAQYPPGYPGMPAGVQAAQPPVKLSDRPTVDTTSSTGAPVLVQLDQLETDLKLTPEQRAAWDAYADVVLRLADDMTRSQFVARASPQPTQATATQQLDQLAESERNRLTAVEEIATAGKALYAILSSEQRTIADRRLVLPIRPLASGVAFSR